MTISDFELLKSSPLAWLPIFVDVPAFMNDARAIVVDGVVRNFHNKQNQNYQRWKPNTKLTKQIKWGIDEKGNPSPAGPLTKIRPPKPAMYKGLMMSTGQYYNKLRDWRKADIHKVSASAKSPLSVNIGVEGAGIYEMANLQYGMNMLKTPQAYNEVPHVIGGMFARTGFKGMRIKGHVRSSIWANKVMLDGLQMRLLRMVDLSISRWSR